MKYIKKIVLSGMLLLFGFLQQLNAEIYIRNETATFFSVEIRPAGSTQYTKLCNIDLFTLKKGEQRKLSDAQGNYACPDIVVSIWTSNNKDFRLVQRLKLSTYDFEGTRDAPVQKDEVIVIRKKEDRFVIELLER